MKAIFCLIVCAAAGRSMGVGQTRENAVNLYKGLGSWHHSISTTKPQAQKFFDQGLILAYSFNRYEALRSFRRASELDPSSAMAFWGIAISMGPYVNMDGDSSFNLKQSCTAVASASKLTDAPEVEKAYLKVASSWCPEFRPDAYVEAARKLAAEYPDDPDAQTIYADSLLVRVRWHWYDSGGTAAKGVVEAERILQSTIRRWPQHPGANHLYIHAVESSPSPERGIASAQRLMGLVPWAGHMVHMPAHIWLVLGDWEMAASLNERAATVDQEYFELTGLVGGSYEPYYLHNLHFILYARSMQGNKAQSLQAAEKLAAASRAMESGMPEMADSFGAFATLVYARFNQWDALLKRPPPGKKMLATQAALSYARALAFAAQGNKAAATREQEHLEELRNSVPADAVWGANNASQEMIHVASEALAARFSEKGSDGCEHWQRAVDLQDHLVYDEPPGWYYPLRESLGGCLLRAGHNSEATRVFREGVRRCPRDGRMLFGLMESLRAQDKFAEMDFVRREYEAAWSGADITLSTDDL